MDPELVIPTLATAPIYALASAVLGGLAIMWVIRKSIKTTNKS